MDGRLLALLEKHETEWPVSLTVGFWEGELERWPGFFFFFFFQAARLGLLSGSPPAPLDEELGWGARRLDDLGLHLLASSSSGNSCKLLEPDP